MAATDTYYRNLDAVREFDLVEIGTRAANHAESETQFGWEFVDWLIDSASVVCHVCDQTRAQGHVWDCPIGLGL